MTRLRIATLVLSVFGAALSSYAAEVFNVQGRLISSAGSAFTGMGQFKFAIVNRNGAVLWKNDGTVNAGQPTNSVAQFVTEGIYNVQIGNPALSNMAKLPENLFKDDGLQLLTWFNEGRGEFIQLQPATPIVSVPRALHANTVADQAITPAKFHPSTGFQLDALGELHQAKSFEQVPVQTKGTLEIRTGQAADITTNVILVSFEIFQVSTNSIFTARRPYKPGVQSWENLLGSSSISRTNDTAEIVVNFEVHGPTPARFNFGSAQVRGYHILRGLNGELFEELSMDSGIPTVLIIGRAPMPPVQPTEQWQVSAAIEGRNNFVFEVKDFEKFTSWNRQLSASETVLERELKGESIAALVSALRANGGVAPLYLVTTFKNGDRVIRRRAAMHFSKYVPRIDIEGRVWEQLHLLPGAERPAFQF